ncbi:uncharacterized protein EI90DRAFT_1871342 [Cantharellus anzutake]|uniref:uncharacterized protein n=1 Tax=Cantharellus anzutake TaxID=1750568 RepID=UPI001905A5C9|nr:uncharacterized protein EI90DRAFT_1871342 [Cantharellus anzutake]KAF8326799.1 hypothetical protein EI90DRAFT_1871342 [Cantharellus anzutake]
MASKGGIEACTVHGSKGDILAPRAPTPQSCFQVILPSLCALISACRYNASRDSVYCDKVMKI